MEIQPNQVRILNTESELEQFLKNQPLNTELRFPSKTASQGKRAYLYCVPTPDRQYVALALYLKHKSFLKKEIDAGRHSLKPAAEAIVGLRQETGLRANTVKIFSRPIKVGNTDEDVKEKFHFKWLVVAEDYGGELYTRDQLQEISEKVIEYVWAHVNLIPVIFLRKVRKTKPHPQKQCAKRFLGYLQKNLFS